MALGAEATICSTSDSRPGPTRLLGPLPPSSLRSSSAELLIALEDTQPVACSAGVPSPSSTPWAAPEAEWVCPELAT